MNFKTQNLSLKYKLIIYLLLTSLIAVLCCSTAAAAPDEITITLQIDNSYMQIGDIQKEIDSGRGTAPIIANDRTIVPIRAIVEEIGGTVEWDQSTSTANLTYGAVNIQLKVNDTLAYVNGVVHTLDVAPVIINGRTMMPIRFIAEKFGLDVNWLPETSQILITTNIYNDKLLVVHYIDVGQGDAAFVQLPNGKSMLIDAGPKNDIVNKYIANLGYDKIDYIVATHPDADHIGGMPQILDEFNVGVFYMSAKSHTTKLFESMLDNLEANGCKVAVAKNGIVITEDSGYHIEFVAPVKIYDDNNNSSAVIMVKYGNLKFLFTGDIEQLAEKDILNSGADIDADVLKVAHHGSKSSTTEAFLDAVSPKLAVISAGKDNNYGHPSAEVISSFDNRYIKYYVTAHSGTVVLTCDGIECTVKCFDNKSEINSQQNTTINIYRTATGKKYHISDCPSLKSKIEISLTQAYELGLGPCAICKPPTLGG